MGADGPEAGESRVAAAGPLRERDPLPRLALRGARIGAWEHDLADGSVRWSPELEELFGLPAGSFEGSLEAFTSRVHPEDRAAVAQAIVHAIERSDEYAVEFRFRHASGEWRWMDGRGTVRPDADGQPTRLCGIGIDITERKRAEQALADQTRTLETLNRLATTLTAELDLGRVVQLVTDAATELSGAAFGTLFYTDPAHGADSGSQLLFAVCGARRADFASFPLPRMTAIVERTFRAEGILRSDDITRDPRYGQNAPHRGMPAGNLPVRSYLAAPVTSRSGNVLGGLFLGHPQPGMFTERTESLVAGLIAPAAIAIENARLFQAAQREIAARTAAEAALRESEARFRHIADHSPVLVWVTGPDGATTYQSESWYAYTGQARDGGGDFAWLEAVHPEDRSIAEERFRRANAARQPYRSEYRLWHRSGEYRWVLSSAVPFVDERGSFLGYIGSTLDIDDRKRDEQTRALLAAIVESSNDAIVSTTLDGVLTSWNAAATRLFGYEAEEALGRPITVLLPPERWHEEQLTREKTGRGERIENFETERARKDGTRIHLSITISPVRDSGGNIVGTSRVARDITKRRLAEERLREQERRKDEFLTILSHELRNPLAPMRNALHIMRVAEGDAAATAAARTMLERQFGQITRIVDALTDVSRLTHGKFTLRRARVELSSVLQLAIEAAQPLLDSKQHVLEVERSGEPLPVDADATRLAQVFTHLLNNGAKYTPPAGRIAVQIGRRGDRAVATVSDSGVGIPEGMLQRIFELFVQVEPADGGMREGLGIGLTLVKQLVELHGGTVAARSGGPGRGSTFEISLPLAPTATGDAPRPAATPAAAQDAHARILVADDNRDAAQSLALMLGLAGHEVRTASDGIEALEIGHEFQPQILLLDVGMPRLNGYATARRVRECAWGKEALLVAVTGWGQDEDRRRALQAGFDRHLVKPVDPEVLMGLVTRYLTDGAQSRR